MKTEEQVEENVVVTLVYDLRSGGPNGKLLESMDARYPFIFLFGGKKKLLPTFEKHIYGLREGDGFEFTLTPEEGYGLRLLENVLEIPRTAFDPGMIYHDNFVTLTEDETGEKLNGKILSWTDENVKVDFNHAMAGHTLHFKGAVIHLRAATVDELVRGHYIIS